MNRPEDSVPPLDPENGAYSRRRIDELTDQRFRDLETDVGAVDRKVDAVDAKVDALSVRMAMMFGGLAVLSVIVSIVGPLVASRVIGL